MNKRISFVLGVALVVNLFGMVAPARAQVWWNTVPDVVGMTEAAARWAIRSNGLWVDISYEYSDTVPYAQVISQDPPGGTSLRRDIRTRVDLVIGGPQMVDVPDVVGMAWADAESEITSAGLITGAIDRNYLYSDTVPHRHIIRQDPAGGTAVCIGASVRLFICIKYKVPDVVGMTEADAKGALASDFSYHISRENSATVPEGLVISQSPEAGTWVRWRFDRVNLVISRGPWPVVPDVVGKSKYAAERAIRDHGLRVGDISREYSDTVPKGRVISQDPEAGKMVAWRSEVDLVISHGPWPVGVPDVVGWNWSEAVAEISVGYKVWCSSEYSDTVPEGHVISQDPAGGTRVDRWSGVRLFISDGPGAPWIVPDVVGMTKAAAESAITSAGLFERFSYEYSNSVPEGRVISQDPEAGTLVRQYSRVKVVISLGPCTVPDVVGMSESDAASAINSAGLSVGSMYLYSDTVPDGFVISQYPAAGTVADPGSAVDLDISMGPDTGGPKVDVPDVEGKTEAAARSRITSASLLVGYILREYHNRTDKGHVISQDPTAGTSVFRGTTVYLVISLGERPMEITSLSGLEVPIEVGVPFTILVSGYRFDWGMSVSISGPGASIFDQRYKYHIEGKSWERVDGIWVDVVFSCAASN